MTGNMYVYGYEEQSNIAYELFTSVTKSVKKAINSYHEELLLKEIQVRTFNLLSDIYVATAEIESFRDMVDGYYINDVEVDEKVLNSFFHYFEEKKDLIEEFLDAEEYNKLPIFIGEKLHDSLDKLYAQLVNASFDVSLKIGESYVGSESNYNLLQDA
jgi:hypothetical protein